jgi:hypothetical protein
MITCSPLMWMVNWRTLLRVSFFFRADL